MYYDTSKDIRFTSKVITAKRRALNVKWTMDTAVMLSKEEVNTDIEEELLEQVIASIKQEMMPEQYSKYKKLSGLYKE